MVERMVSPNQGGNKAEKRQIMKNWVVQYVYASEQQGQGVSITHIQAETLEKAKEIAAEKAAAEEFVFTIAEQSDDQFLGSVKHDANRMAGKTDIIENYEE